jgi:vacuolar-type H+-ATPase subunit E/Vma4
VNVDRLRADFLAQATKDGELAVSAAEDTRRARLAAAHRRVSEIVGSARAAGEAEAELEAARARAGARRRARSVTLAARLELYRELRREALEAAGHLRAQPSYASFIERLERVARSELGANAVIERDAGGAGGVVARAGSRVVDYSLPALVDRCLTVLGERVEELWR